MAKRGTGQRVMIWVLAGIMLVGTLGTFLVMILANENDARDSVRMGQLESEYQAAVDAQRDELNERYFDTLSGYMSRVDSFDADGVKELQTEDLEVGDGEALTSESTFTAYYIGWNPDGEVFDSSIEGEALKDPFTASPAGVIAGWTNGVDGMNVGGVRELTIPSDQAYGETGSGELIPPNTPLKFVMLVIPTPEQVEVPDELMRYWTRQYGGW